MAVSRQNSKTNPEGIFVLKELIPCQFVLKELTPCQFVLKIPFCIY